MGVGLPLIWPGMTLIAWNIDTQQQLIEIARGTTAQFITFAYGLIAGSACGLLCSWSTLNSQRILEDRIHQSTIEQFNYVDDVIAAMALVGILPGLAGSSVSDTFLFNRSNRFTVVGEGSLAIRGSPVSDSFHSNASALIDLASLYQTSNLAISDSERWRNCSLPRRNPRGFFGSSKIRCRPAESSSSLKLAFEKLSQRKRIPLRMIEESYSTSPCNSLRRSSSASSV